LLKVEAPSDDLIKIDAPSDLIKVDAPSVCKSDLQAEDSESNKCTYYETNKEKCGL
jgi:hypothetical protein